MISRAGLPKGWSFNKGGLSKGVHIHIDISCLEKGLSHMQADIFSVKCFSGESGVVQTT